MGLPSFASVILFVAHMHLFTATEQGALSNLGCGANAFGSESRKAHTALNG